MIEHISKATHSNAPKMLAEISSSSHQEAETKPPVAKMDPKDNEDVILIDEEETEASSEKKEPVVSSEPSIVVAKNYVSNIDESEDVIFFSNDSN